MTDNNFDILRTPEYSKYIYKSRYARWLPEENRRETWEETVCRYVSFFLEKYKILSKVGTESAVKDLYARLYDNIYNYKVMPSMRSLMTAGKALERDQTAGYNCSAISVNDPRVFDEIMYVLMCGSGMGYSVERHFTDKLPKVSESFYETDTVISVRDSKIGWASAYRELLSLLWSGKVPKWDTSKVRPEGAKLKTFGGRASGPEPLEDLFKFTVNCFRRFADKKFPTLVVSDLVCKIAEVIVIGGVRRSALICLSDRDDDMLRFAKSSFKVIEYTLLDKLESGNRKYSVLINDHPYGERSLILELDDWESEQLQSEHLLNWWHVHPERALANISIAYKEAPSISEYMKESLALYESKSGERGIYNRIATNSLLPQRRKDLGYTEFLCNPLMIAA